MSGRLERPEAARWSARAYGRFVAAVAATVAALAVLGAVVSALRGDGSGSAAAAAVGVTGLASALSGIPVAFAGGPPSAMLHRALLAMLIRLGLVAGLGAVCVLGFGLARGPFLIWLVVAYLVLLAVDTIFSVRGSERPPDRL